MEYRIPDISEFKQGFKFQILRNKKGDHLAGIHYSDPEYDKEHGKELFWEEDNWVDVEVWWDRKPGVRTVGHFTFKEFPQYDWLPWIKPGYIEKLIEEGKVRCNLLPIVNV